MARTRAALFFLLLSSTALADYDYNCNCDEDGTLWSIRNIVDCQRVSDFLIAAAYLSIPIELLYFVSFSNFPFKWVLVEFIAFIVLCGLTHLLNGLIYGGSTSFRLMFYLTVAKFLTALVSCATAITFLPLIPMLLKLKVRELFLRQNVLELDQEIGMMKKQKEASRHVRMLTRKIRTSLDKHTILYTTLVELSKTLDLYNCLVWMPNKTATMLDLTHGLKPNDRRFSIPIKDPYVVEIKKTRGVVILKPDSELACVASNSSSGGPVGPAAAIRVPLLQVSDFKGGSGTPQFINTRYAILVLVLMGPDSRKWTYNEVEIVEVVADQVAVALSHATVLEESQLMREKLRDQNRVLLTARKDAVMASAAKESFQKVMSHGMRRPMHSITGLLSILEPMRSEQKLLVDSMMKTSSVLSTLINDVMGVSAKPNLETRPFELRALMKEVSCLAKCLCLYKGLGFSVDVRSSLPDRVVGDEKRTFQVILHMVGYLLDVYEGEGSVHFRVFSASGDEIDKVFVESAYVKFEVEICGGGEVSASSVLDVRRSDRDRGFDVSTDSLGFTMYKRLVQRMQGNIKTTSTSQGLPDRMTLVLRFPLPPLQDYAHTANPEPLRGLLGGLHVLLADDDHTNMTVTNKQLTKLGCQVTAVSSGFDCLSALSRKDNSFRVVLLDLHLSDMDGFEVAMRIGQLMSRNRPLIIALTVSAEERVTSKCLQSGMNGVVRKPVVVQTLADEILRVLNRVGGV